MTIVKLINNFKKCLAIRKNELSLYSQSQKGSLAQLVQSICLTSRGSAVRIRQLPQKKEN